MIYILQFSLTLNITYFVVILIVIFAFFDQLVLLLLLCCTDDIILCHCFIVAFFSIFNLMFVFVNVICAKFVEPERVGLQTEVK